jgi:hypothetical protein
MNPIAAVVTPVLLTTVFALSYLGVYHLVRKVTFWSIVGALGLALLGSFALDIALSIIIGNF